MSHEEAVALTRDSGVAASGAGTRRFGFVRHPLLRVVVRRVAGTVPLLFIVSALTFVLVSLVPGDATLRILGPQAGEEAREQLRHDLGLDLPLYEQYWRWLRHAVTGDLGTSLFNGEAVTKAIGGRFPVTFSLVVGSLVVIVLVGVGLGVFSAVRGGVAGRFLDGLSLVGFAVPGFWLGAVLIALFAVGLHWFPAVGYVPFAESPSGWARSLVLPVSALAVHNVAVLAKQTREAMLDVLASEHMRMAWASGVPSRLIFFRLGLKNAAIRAVTVAGLQAVGLLGGTVFIEQVFALPGLGWALLNAAQQGDLAMAQGITLFFTLIIVLMNLIVDLTYSWLNPRVRTS
jgi:peptide/nickel transport system permease protein